MAFWRTPAPVRRHYFDLEFGQVHVRDNGARAQSALPVLCLHPLPLSGRSFTHLLKAFSPMRFAVAPDLPGYGLSNSLSDKSGLAECANAVLQLAAASGLRKFALLSVASSAMVAAEAARRAPQQIEALLLMDPQIPAPGLSVNLRADGGHLKDIWARLDTVFGADRPSALKQRDLAEALQSYAHWALPEVRHENDLAQVLELVSQPVHVIASGLHGSTDVTDSLPVNKSINRLDCSDWAPGALDLQSDQIAEVINELLENDRAKPLSLTPPPDRFPGQGTVRRAYLDSAYGQLHCRISEPLDPQFVPLTCFHASPQSGVIFENLLSVMGEDRIALAPDTPGFGESDGPLAAPEIEDYAKAMAAFLDRLGISQTDLLGFHTGSMTAVELARQRPDLIRRIVMVSAPIFTPEELAAFRAHYKPMTYVADGTHNVAAWQSFWQWRGPKQDIGNYARNNALTLRGGLVKHWGHRAAFNYVLGETIGQVEHPILVFNPDDDLRDQTLRAAPLMQNGSIVDIAPLSHGMFDDSTEHIAALLKDFLDPA